MQSIPAATASSERYGVLSRGSIILLVVLLLGETTINYIDRQVVSVLAPTLRSEFSLTNSQYAGIVNAFLAVFAPTRFRDGFSIVSAWAGDLPGR